jgi:hypothetical protein
MTLLICSATCQWFVLPFGGRGMTLLIFSDMPIFAVELILKHFSWHVAVKTVWAF